MAVILEPLECSPRVEDCLKREQRGSGSCLRLDPEALVALADYPGCCSDRFFRLYH